MKKNENKQKKSSSTALKNVLKNDGRKLTWLAAVTNIQYQRLQRIVNQGYDPSIREAVKIAGALRKPITALFPLDGLEEAFLQNDSALSLNSVRPVKGNSEI
ncbi:MAG TPA: helix-turn-helix transcriptional regulator [Bacteroidota bacterium]|nr:helix-turn-helix transcriptional regulator [Bacteroidota bacterium]